MPHGWELTTLDSGLRVLTTSVPTAQSAASAFFVRVGSRDEQPKTNGLSHYIEHMLFKGTEQRRARQQPREEAQDVVRAQRVRVRRDSVEQQSRAQAVASQQFAIHLLWNILRLDLPGREVHIQDPAIESDVRHRVSLRPRSL